MDANPDLSVRFFQHAGVVNFPAIFVGDIPGSYALFRAPVVLDFAPVLCDRVWLAGVVLVCDFMPDGPANRGTGYG
jgi:hypothetical protein